MKKGKKVKKKKSKIKKGKSKGKRKNNAKRGEERRRKKRKSKALPVREVDHDGADCSMPHLARPPPPWRESCGDLVSRHHHLWVLHRMKAEPPAPPPRSATPQVGQAE